MLRHLRFYRAMYEWVERWAERPSAAWALFVFAWIDNIFFPIPSEVLQYALYATRPKRSFAYAGIVVVGTLFGAATGYLLGHSLEPVARWLVDLLGRGTVEDVRRWLQDHLFTAAFVGSLTPFSDKTIVLGAGILRLSPWEFALAYTLGRAARTLPAATLFYFLGPKVRPWIERYVEPIGVVLTVVLTASVVAAIVWA